MSEPPDIFLIAVDTLRADRIGSFGYHRATTPRIDALAEDSVVFENCQTVATSTLCSFTSMFASLYPHEHGVPDNWARDLPASLVMLPEVLRDSGYRTAGFVGGYPLRSASNFAQGFDEYSERRDPPPEDPGGWEERKAPDLTNDVLAWLRTSAREAARFVFVQYWDVHVPYIAPATYAARFSRPYTGSVRGRTEDTKWVQNRWRSGEAAEDIGHLSDLYDAEIAFTDEHIGRLLDALDRDGIMNSSLIIVTSDHGETFLEHRPHLFHGYTVYQTEAHVPLIVRFPQGQGGPRRISQPVRTIDIAPTVLGVAGVPPPPSYRGKDLRELMREEAPQGAPACFSQATKSITGATPDATWPNHTYHHGVRWGSWKYIVAPELSVGRSEELYRLDRDSSETHNLIHLTDDDPEIREHREALRALIDAYRGSELQSTSSAAPFQFRSPGSLSPEVREAMENLGYLR